MTWSDCQDDIALVVCMISLLALTTVVVIFKVSHTVSLIGPVHNMIIFFLF